ncbi:hypothetical protein MACH16_19990 [Marinomonas pontica]|jgi:hypothetical protein|uniref:Tryptophan synthase subunit beta like protein n=1 Tax=Marinomonas pontica TaxID=264739 RepID=A0ABN6WMP3_9GAMM|nr:hypothetical protein [Marinomonas pontica]MCW8357296.1 hypothetical protein [Marinomonas pontica]BDX03251.1 hypothetical protein MACH16_19990 [Marinomonas pontica]
MLYAKVDADGVIVDVATSQSNEYKLLVAPNDPTVASILEKKFTSASTSTQEILSSSDGEMMRILEDLVDLLTEKRLIQFTELPLAAQKKLLGRKWVRGVHSNNDESLMIENDHLGEDSGDSLI